MKRKSAILRALYLARDFHSRALFGALERHARGSVLDVGGWDFLRQAQDKGVTFERWTILEHDTDRLLSTDDPRVTVTHGDGCAMDFADASFDTVLNVQVLEHVFEPMRMVDEITRVLKPGGHAIFLVPSTSTVHLAPNYYGNLSRYWIEEAMRRADLTIVELEEIGGLWSTIAAYHVFFFMHATRVEGMSDPAIRRDALYWILLPFQVLFALVCIPICLVMSLGDLREAPNNHLVVVRKKYGA